MASDTTAHHSHTAGKDGYAGWRLEWRESATVKVFRRIGLEIAKSAEDHTLVN
jgi:hypothetical protein